MAKAKKMQESPIRDVPNVEERVKELNEERKDALLFTVSGTERMAPTAETIAKVEGLLNELKGRYQPPLVPAQDPNDRRFSKF